MQKVAYFLIQLLITMGITQQTMAASPVTEVKQLWSGACPGKVKAVNTTPASGTITILCTSSIWEGKENRYSDLYKIQLSTGAVLHHTHLDSRIPRPKFTADGEFIVSVENNLFDTRAKVYRAEGLIPLTVIDIPDTHWSMGDYSPQITTDNKYFAINADSSHSVLLVDIQTGKIARRFKADRQFHRFVISGDGQYVGWTYYDNGNYLAISNFATGERILTTYAHQSRNHFWSLTHPKNKQYFHIVESHKNGLAVGKDLYSFNIKTWEKGYVHRFSRSSSLNFNHDGSRLSGLIFPFSKYGPETYQPKICEYEEGCQHPASQILYRGYRPSSVLISQDSSYYLIDDAKGVAIRPLVYGSFDDELIPSGPGEILGHFQDRFVLVGTEGSAALWQY